MRPNFAKKNPNDPHHRWMVLRSFTFTLYQIITTDGFEEPVLPIGRIPTHEEDANCDRWFRKLFKQDTMGPKDTPPPKLAPWLWARVLAVETFIDEQIENQAKAPNYPQVPEALEDLLVNRWPTEMLQRWKEFTYDGTDVLYRDEMVLHRPGRNHGPAQTADEDHDNTEMTWQNVYNYTEMLGPSAKRSRCNCRLARCRPPTSINVVLNG